MSIIDIFDVRFLVEEGIDTPSSSDDADITFLYHMSRYFERSQTVPYLPNRVEFIEFRAHNCRFVRDVAFWKSFITWTVDTFSRTSPWFCEDRDNRNSRQTPNRSLSKEFPYSRFILQNTLVDESIISIEENNPRNGLRELVFCVDFILELMKLLLGCYFRMEREFP